MIIEDLKKGKPRSIVRFVLPTFEHNIIIIFRASFRRFQALVTRFIDGFENLLTSKSSPWLKTIAKHFPESHSKSPHIRGRSELQIVDTFRSTPGNR